MSEYIPKVEENQLSLEEQVLQIYEEYIPEPEIGEKYLITTLVEIYNQTEIPRFDMGSVTSSHNNQVEPKAKQVFSIIPEDIAIPENMRGGYPLNFDNETKLKAPWINLVHGWSKVFNCMNSISGMQGENEEFDPKLMAGIVRDLYLFTTHSDPNPFLRTDDEFLDGEYVETTMRRFGTKGANPKRHVSLKEMQYMLSVVKEKYSK